ncbi:ribosome maturation factor RimP [Sulfuricystis multivorans]|uniref:ribosome maturation factor RimP n=1 Tax=Sulfuricystis multivorans TaxID=2211108 RepID=UPI000F82E074|nr:ribosome maturation factor RimP [Sulfuricystis multivorans]
MADLAGLVEQAVVGLGYELVDFETSPRARLLRVFIDRPAGDPGSPMSGVTVDDCATVSNHLTRLFEVENVDYDRLEVSSPGLDRLLKKPADFARFVGQEVQVKLRVAAAGAAGAAGPLQRNFSGTILGVGQHGLRLAVAGGEREFAFDNIEKARLVPKF